MKRQTTFIFVEFFEMFVLALAQIQGKNTNTRDIWQFQNYFSWFIMNENYLSSLSHSMLRFTIKLSHTLSKPISFVIQNEKSFSIEIHFFWVCFCVCWRMKCKIIANLRSSLTLTSINRVFIVVSSVDRVLEELWLIIYYNSQRMQSTST